MEQTTTIPESLVTAEFNRSTEKAHIIACWIGIALNLVWFLGDYLSIREFWIPFLIFRVVVSSISLIALVFKDIFKAEKLHTRS